MKVLKVEMADGSVWQIPLSICIAEYRFRHKPAMNYEQAMNRALEMPDDLIDYIENNTDWLRILPHAECVKASSVDYEDGWHNGEKWIEDTSE